MHPQVATLDEVAHMLGLHRNTVAARVLNVRTMPGAKMGRGYRFWRPAVLAYARGIPYSDPSKDDELGPDVELLSVSMAAEVFGMAENTIRTLAKNGEIPAMQLDGVWRVRWPCVRDLMAGIALE